MRSPHGASDNLIYCRLKSLPCRCRYRTSQLDFGKSKYQSSSSILVVFVLLCLLTLISSWSFDTWICQNLVEKSDSDTCMANSLVDNKWGCRKLREEISYDTREVDQRIWYSLSWTSKSKRYKEKQRSYIIALVNSERSIAINNILYRGLVLLHLKQIINHGLEFNDLWHNSMMLIIINIKNNINLLIII